jgi:hypothetical protein
MWLNDKETIGVYEKRKRENRAYEFFMQKKINDEWVLVN